MRYRGEITVFLSLTLDMCAVTCPRTCGIGENGGSETVSSDGIGFGGVIGDELL